LQRYPVVSPAYQCAKNYADNLKALVNFER